MFVVARPDQSQPHIDAMREVVQRLTATDTSSTTEASTFNLNPELEARMVEQDRLYHEGEKGVALSLDTLPPYLGGVPGVDQCGYDDGTGFTPSADQNQGL